MKIARSVHRIHQQRMNDVSRRLWSALCVALLCLELTAGQDGYRRTLKEIFYVYVDAVRRADLEGILATITEGDTLHFLNASGKLTTTREEYVSSHREWFKEQNWQISFQFVAAHELNAGSGYALGTFHYTATNDGEQRELDSYFTLVFRRERGLWRVVADICTPIRR